MGMKTAEKVHYKDIEEVQGTIEVKCYKVNGELYNSMHKTKMSLVTHYDCDTCGEEFETEGRYYTTCAHCRYKKSMEKYNSLDLVEWDGKTPLYLWDDDKYFFNEDEIHDYCEDNELELSDLCLVLCSKSTFREIDLDIFLDDTHEDWEPSDEMVKKINEFNEFLKSESTDTWFPTNKRVRL